MRARIRDMTTRHAWETMAAIPGWSIPELCRCRNPALRPLKGKDPGPAAVSGHPGSVDAPPTF